MRPIGAIAMLAALGACVSPVPSVVASYEVRGDAIESALTESPGDPARGREILMGRDGNCLLCHALPETGARFMGNLAPPLSGVASRLSAGQIRLRIVDSLRIDPGTIMPSYHRVHGLERVAEPFRGRPILTAQQVEDVVAYLSTLR